MKKDDIKERTLEHKIISKPVELITGVIIAQSFLAINSVFIPIWKIFEYPNSVDAFGIFLAYFIVISGWMGYHISISKNPPFGKWRYIRYIIDLLVLFLVYYTVTIAHPDSIDQYGMLFLWVIPFMFFLYCIWDYMKYIEYRNAKTEYPVYPTRMRISFYFLIIFYGLSWVYYLININCFYFGLTFWENKTSIDMWFMVLYFILFIFYRIMKLIREKTAITNANNT